MLEPYNNYCIKEIGNLKDFFTIVYTIIDDIYQRVAPTYIKNRRNSNNSIMSDSEIITIRLAGELFTIDSEKAWFGFYMQNMRDLFPNFCDRTRFNRIHRSLHIVIEEIRKEVVKLTEYSYQSYRIVDSIPIPVCKFGRAHFHKTFRGYGKLMVNALRKKLTWVTNCIF
jgi:hypothetical protein